ncbi:retrovirus-related pol polyprotein from transposon TNT 1-94 [Tanacetum coccineum]
MNINGKFHLEDGTGLTDATVYRSLVRRLSYLTHSRPDVAYSVGILSLIYASSNNASSRGSKKNPTSSLKKQATVALSSTKAEYVAACAVAC